MELSVWLALVAASVVVLLAPGPTIFFAISQALRYGNSNMLSVGLGVALGDLVAISLALLGLGFLLSASPILFSTLKIAGGCYLIYLGLKAIRSSTSLGISSKEVNTGSQFAAFTHAALITVLNPKSIIFFVAFIPGFIDSSSSYPLQAAIIIPTFVGLGFANVMAYSFLAVLLRDNFLQGKATRLINRAVGVLLAGFGVALLAYNDY